MSWEELLLKAYVPYSKQADACIVKGDKGSHFLGVRIENVSFPLTISSIQAACSICLSYGQTPISIIVHSKDDPQLSFWENEFDCDIIIGDVPEEIELINYRERLITDKKPYLKKLLANAVTKNSNFPVSAILNTSNYSYSGVNIEVSDWSKGLCAERVAICKAIADGELDFTSISVHTLKGEFSSPCGACRQVMTEHFPLSKAELFHADGTYSEHFIIDLLPFSFTSRDLRN